MTKIKAVFAVIIAGAILSSVSATYVRSSERILHSFPTTDGDGARPVAELLHAPDGNFYGTTASGGQSGFGTVFKLTSDGTESVIHSFALGPEGNVPSSGLVVDTQGNLYGTTGEGGTGCYPSGCGVVFKVFPDGTVAVLHAFTDISDGALPAGTLVMDDSQNLYGATFAGGGPQCHECGTVFKISRDGTESMLYAFLGGNDGYEPLLTAIDAAGNMYGTTRSGGGGAGCHRSGGCGTVFKLTPSGTKTVLHSFPASRHDGKSPVAGVIVDNAGNLYGTTYVGGIHGNGIVFKLAADGTETVLHAFAGTDDGAHPSTPLIMDSVGDLYGTTFTGGGTGCQNQAGCGTVFKIASDGTETVLYKFQGGNDGESPTGLTLTRKGNIYGATENGGEDYYGTAFRLKN